MKRLLITCFILFGVKAYSQSITNVVSSQQGNNAVVTYDLNGISGTDYYVRLLYSTDNGQSFSSELKQVSGDVKGGVKAGTGKRITWAADKEVNFLNSSVVFKVEAEVKKGMPKPVTINGNIILEITSSKKNGDQINLEFILTQNTESEIIDIYLKQSSEITTQDGSQIKSTSGKFGSESLSYGQTSSVKCTKGVPVKGQLIFKLDSNDQILLAARIDLYNNSIANSFSGVVKNIPIE